MTEPNPPNAVSTAPSSVRPQRDPARPKNHGVVRFWRATALATLARVAANVSPFVASPVLAPLAMLGWGAKVGTNVGAMVGAEKKSGPLSALIRDAVAQSRTVLLADTRTPQENTTSSIGDPVGHRRPPHRASGRDGVIPAAAEAPAFGSAPTLRPRARTMTPHHLGGRHPHPPEITMHTVQAAAVRGMNISQSSIQSVSQSRTGSRVRSALMAALAASVLNLGACAMAPMAATPMAMTAQLASNAEVPPAMGTGMGTLDAQWAPDTRMLTWTLSWSGLSGPATGAHFHGPAFAGLNAAVVVPIMGPLTSPVRGSATLTAEQAADLRDGKWYVNVHSALYPGGEIRGQVMPR
jgi:hypothetical protein